MNILFRVDSSIQIGTGHVARCLALADGLRGKGCRVEFLCRELPGDMGSTLETMGYPVRYLRSYPLGEVAAGRQPASGPAVCGTTDWEADAEKCVECLRGKDRPDWLVVDQYSLDRRWESRLRAHVGRILVIDDLADRPHDCDVLLDQNLCEHPETRYGALVPPWCRMLLGPEYALLRPEFAAARKRLAVRDGTIRRILIFFGGADATNETAKALEAVRLLARPDVGTDVVVGGANPRKEHVRSLCERLPSARFHQQVRNMAELMAGADVAIGAAGVTTWERCCLGLPSVVVIIAENQRGVAEHLGKLGVIRNLGWYESVSARGIASVLEDLIRRPAEMLSLSRISHGIVDGKGVERVSGFLLG